jgi:GntR family transcriptional repressor for pyruvate dehydrogenase complex
MEFRELRKQVLAEEIVQDILSMIKEGKIRPGDKLPPERQLAATLNVSRPSLREALRALSIMNVVKIIQGGGIYVTNLEPERLFEHLEFIFSLDDSTFLQLFEARKIVESGFAEMAARRAQDEDIRQLEVLLKQAIETVDDPDTFLKIDYELHDKIAQIAQNPILNRLMSGVAQLSRASRQRTGEAAAVRHQATEDHRVIVAAIAAHDPVAAREAMLSHLSHVEASLMDSASRLVSRTSQD